MEAWDKDSVYDYLVGGVMTNEERSFRMEFDDAYFFAAANSCRENIQSVSSDC